MKIFRQFIAFWLVSVGTLAAEDTTWPTEFWDPASEDVAYRAADLVYEGTAECFQCCIDTLPDFRAHKCL